MSRSGLTDHASNGMERMRVGMRFFIVNTLAIKYIDAHASRRMDNMSIAHADAYVDDAPFGIVKKCKVVALDIAMAYFLAVGGLL